MANQKSERYSKSFTTGISTLLDELKLAAQWSRPSILLAVHRSTLGRQKAKDAMSASINAETWRVVDIRVTDTQANIPQLIREHKKNNATVFFIEGLSENENSFHSLNVQREMFVEEKIRAIFWLTEADAATLPRLAPDFWAFRHRVVEFAPGRGSANNGLASGALLWTDFNGFKTVADLESIIQQNETTLNLTGIVQAPALRMTAITSLLHAHWLKGNEANLEKIAKISLAMDDIGHLNGKAILEYHKGNYNSSLQMLQKAEQIQSMHSVITMNTAITLQALAKNKAALQKAEQAIEMDRTNPLILHAAGCVHLAAGKTPQAVEYFEKAMELDSRNTDFPFALAVCFYKTSQPEKSLAMIQQREPKTILQKAWKGILQNQGDMALNELKFAVQRGDISSTQVNGDVYLRFLLGSALTGFIAS
jgi:tetratricopeptide (TPR) repeat protein